MPEENNEVSVPITEQEWYQHFIEEARSVISVAEESARMDIIKGKWMLGKMMIQNEDMFERAGYGERKIETAASDIGIASSQLWKCLQFARKYNYEEWESVENELPEGRNISWNKIQTKYLPETTREGERGIMEEERQQNCNHERIKCAICGVDMTPERERGEESE